jgi:parallel beta-helix repeat protein
LIDGGTFSNNIIEGCSVGIYLAMSKNVTVSHNIIRYSTIGSGDSYFANAGAGILNWNTKAWGTGNWQDPINNIIESNVIEYSARQGICLGAWEEIFSVSGTVIRDNIIRYSGNEPGIDLMYVTGVLNITGNDIHSNPTGIGVGPGVSDVIAHYNNISGNTAYGINNTSSVIVNATDNWWGDPTGPQDLSNDTATGGWYNPLGLGNAVSDRVKYDPYQTQESGVTGGEGCFIATAAYGSYLDSHVDTLRSFRDQYLETNPIGSAFVSLYYKVSPPMAAFIDEHPTLKPVVRAGLMPAVAMSSVALNTTLAEKAVILIAMALFAAVLIMWLMRRARRLERR